MTRSSVLEVSERPLPERQLPGNPRVHLQWYSALFIILLDQERRGIGCASKVQCLVGAGKALYDFRIDLSSYQIKWSKSPRVRTHQSFTRLVTGDGSSASQPVTVAFDRCYTDRNAILESHSSKPQILIMENLTS